MSGSDFIISPKNGENEKTSAAKRKKKDRKTDKEVAGNGLDSLSIEEMFEQLDGIIRNLEDGNSSLEASFEYYEAGMRLVKACGQKIDRVEKQILVLSEQEAGE